MGRSQPRWHFLGRLRRPGCLSELSTPTHMPRTLKAATTSICGACKRLAITSGRRSPSRNRKAVGHRKPRRVAPPGFSHSGRATENVGSDSQDPYGPPIEVTRKSSKENRTGALVTPDAMYTRRPSEPAPCSAAALLVAVYCQVDGSTLPSAQARTRSVVGLVPVTWPRKRMMLLASVVEAGHEDLSADRRLGVVDRLAGADEDVAVGREAHLDAVLVGAVAAHDAVDVVVAADGRLVGPDAEAEVDIGRAGAVEQRRTGSPGGWHADRARARPLPRSSRPCPEGCRHRRLARYPSHC